jgi:hypothetical protein
MTVETPTRTTDAIEWLRLAHELVAEQGDPADPLVQAAQHLISCATDVALALPGRDIETAREALSCARAAVGIASYVVCRLGDDARVRRGERLDAISATRGQ